MPDERAHADVELRLPAVSAYVSVLRTATAGIAARLDFTLDDIEDLRVAVGEAAAMALEVAAGDLEARFWLSGRILTISVTTPTSGDVTIDEASFGWQVLTTLAGEAHAAVRAGRLEITLVAKAAPLGATT